ncbi:Alpha/Beta hydrolase protein [Glomus cerebriforme]|uniref:Alpha/Beta hydrolase protein n=1 Tax=Glomus cerebriforme TaxID=658196 RepID=A0A397SSQ1_9GLOM|nr:Alpha/Beta hydrolase protein [Glomus cerebriforme]
MNLIKILTIISFFFTEIIAQVPIYTFPIETVNYYVNGGNGVQIYVEEKGDPKKTTILFTSGHLSSRLSWNPQWYDPNLYERFHLVRWDYRGVGRSDKPKDVNSYSIESNAKDLFVVVTKIKSNNPNKKIVTIGWSIGTQSTLTFMKNNPDIKIDGFISIVGFVNANFMPKITVEFGKILMALADPLDNFSTIIYGINGTMAYRTFKPMSDQYRAFRFGEAVLVAPEYRKSKVNPSDLTDFFSSLSIPTLNIIGEKDAVVLLEHSLYFASLAKNGEKIIYKDVGHSPPWEEKSITNDIARFVSKFN